MMVIIILRIIMDCCSKLEFRISIVVICKLYYILVNSRLSQRFSVSGKSGILFGSCSIVPLAIDIYYGGFIVVTGLTF